jgi:hypothetical protein
VSIQLDGKLESSVVFNVVARVLAHWLHGLVVLNDNVLEKDRKKHQEFLIDCVGKMRGRDF